MLWGWWWGVQERLKKLTIHNQDNTPLEENSKEDDLQENQALEEIDKDVGASRDFSKVWKFAQNHPKDLIIGDSSEKIRIRSSCKQLMDNFTLISHFKPKNVVDALKDGNWILAIEEELNQFERNKVWTLVEGLKIIHYWHKMGF